MTARPASGQPAGWRWLGRVPFAAVVREQERLRDAVIRGDGRETLLLCEHDPVVTHGPIGAIRGTCCCRRRSSRTRGVDLHAASRGGDVTYHGPGQLVGYPIVRLRGGVVGHVTAMARALVGGARRAGHRRALAARGAGLVGWWREDLRLRRTRTPPRRDPRIRAQRRRCAGRIRDDRALWIKWRGDDFDRARARSGYARARCPIGPFRCPRCTSWRRVSRALSDSELDIEFVPEIEMSKRITRMIAA